jgi:hypothetical protein
MISPTKPIPGTLHAMSSVPPIQTTGQLPDCIKQIRRRRQVPISGGGEKRLRVGFGSTVRARCGSAPGLQCTDEPTFKPERWQSGERQTYQARRLLVSNVPLSEIRLAPKAWLPLGSRARSGHLINAPLSDRSMEISNTPFRDILA